MQHRVFVILPKMEEWSYDDKYCVEEADYTVEEARARIKDLNAKIYLSVLLVSCYEKQTCILELIGKDLVKIEQDEDETEDSKKVLKFASKFLIAHNTLSDAIRAWKDITK